MKKTLKPVVIIVLAIVVAGGIGMVLSREEAASPQGASAASQAPPSSPGSSQANDPNFLPKSLPGGQGGRVRGPEKAPVTIVEFGDYQCPSCGLYHPIVQELMKREGDKVKLEFHHFPLIQIHANALPAAKAAEAAGDQNRYWEMNDLLFANQSRWSSMANPETEFLTYATRIGIDANRFMQSYRSPEVVSRILADVERGRTAQVDSTPTFFVNGQRLWDSPQGVQAFQDIVDAKLKTLQ